MGTRPLAPAPEERHVFVHNIRNHVMLTLVSVRQVLEGFVRVTLAGNPAGAVRRISLYVLVVIGIVAALPALALIALVLLLATDGQL